MFSIPYGIVKFRHRSLGGRHLVAGGDRSLVLLQGGRVEDADDARRAWSLEEIANLPVLEPDEAIALLFADPGDPVFDELDTDLKPVRRPRPRPPTTPGT